MRCSFVSKETHKNTNDFRFIKHWPVGLKRPHTMIIPLVFSATELTQIVVPNCYNCVELKGCSFIFKPKLKTELFKKKTYLTTPNTSHNY